MTDNPLPPPPPPAPPPPSGPPPAQQAPYAPIQAGSSSKATTALIFGIIGLIFCPLICSVVALILGYQAKSEIEGSNGMLTGAGKATAAIVLGWVSLALSAIVLVAVLASS